jgi:hypothetical protein
METQEIRRNIARLESINDQLAMELQDVDSLLRDVGFSQGVESLKEAAHDLIAESDQ